MDDFFSDSAPDMINKRILNNYNKKIAACTITNNINNIEAPKITNGFGEKIMYFYNEYISPNLFLIIAVIIICLFLFYRYMCKKSGETTGEHLEIDDDQVNEFFSEHSIYDDDDNDNNENNENNDNYNNYDNNNNNDNNRYYNNYYDNNGFNNINIDLPYYNQNYNSYYNNSNQINQINQTDNNVPQSEQTKQIIQEMYQTYQNIN